MIRLRRRRGEIAASLKEQGHGVVVVVVPERVCLRSQDEATASRKGHDDLAASSCPLSACVFGVLAECRLRANAGSWDRAGLRGRQMSSHTHVPVTSFASSHARPGPEKLAAMRPTSSASRSLPPNTVIGQRRQATDGQMSECRKGVWGSNGGERTRHWPTRAIPVRSTRESDEAWSTEGCATANTKKGLGSMRELDAISSNLPRPPRRVPQKVIGCR